MMKIYIEPFVFKTMWNIMVLASDFKKICFSNFIFNKWLLMNFGLNGIFLIFYIYIFIYFLITRGQFLAVFF